MARVGSHPRTMCSPRRTAVGEACVDLFWERQGGTHMIVWRPPRGQVRSTTLLVGTLTTRED